MASVPHAPTHDRISADDRVQMPDQCRLDRLADALTRSTRSTLPQSTPRAPDSGPAACMPEGVSGTCDRRGRRTTVVWIAGLIIVPPGVVGRPDRNFPTTRHPRATVLIRLTPSGCSTESTRPGGQKARQQSRLRTCTVPVLASAAGSRVWMPYTLNLMRSTGAICGGPRNAWMGRGGCC